MTQNIIPYCRICSIYPNETKPIKTIKSPSGHDHLWIKPSTIKGSSPKRDVVSSSFVEEEEVLGSKEELREAFKLWLKVQPSVLGRDYDGEEEEVE